MTLPFADMGMSAVLARVALQLVKREYQAPGQADFHPLVLIRLAESRLNGYEFPMIRFALHSLSAWISTHRRSQEWLSGVLYRDMMGYTYRRCFFEDYKENRRSTPRITNRGGQLPLFAAGLGLETGETDDAQSATKRDKGDSGDRLDQRDTTKRRTRLSRLGS